MLNISTNEVSNALYDLVYDNHIQTLLKLISSIINAHSNRDAIGFNESNFKSVIIPYLVFIENDYVVKSEYEVERKYLDILLISRDITKFRNHFIIEFKYIKVGDYNQELLNKKIDEARVQISGYSKKQDFKQLDNLHKYIVVFSGSKCVHLELWNEDNIIKLIM